MTEMTRPVMGQDEARRLTERIRITAHNYAEARDRLVRLVQEAKDGHAHEALGYESWTAYLAETLGAEPMRLARDDRRDMVRVLSSEGMGTASIASVVGVTDRQVRRDIGQMSDVPGASIGLDGKTYTRPTPQPQPKDQPMPTTQTRPRTSGPHKKDRDVLNNVNTGLAGYTVALDPLLRYGLDDTISPADAATLHHTLTRHIKTLQRIARQLNTRKEA